MRIRIGYDMSYEVWKPTPLIGMLNVHSSRAWQLENSDMLQTEPHVPVSTYTDVFGNLCFRLVAPKGIIRLHADAIFRDSGAFDEVCPSAIQHEVQDLPFDTLQFLLPSRYCDTDLLSDEAWKLFENSPTGWGRVQAICDFVHNHIRFDYQNSDPTRTASQGYKLGVGVCRDFTHLAIAFTRCMNIPARYCTGYISDISLPPPYGAGDFCAWMEVFLGGRWWPFDPRNNGPRIGRIMIAHGRDAADVPLVHSFGAHRLAGFTVWTDEVID
jgi:transglutaminase-like putative cysteine protease